MSCGAQNISIGSNISIGLAVTSHNAAATCEAKISNVTITGTAGGQWVSQDIGRIAIGLGTQGDMTILGGSGNMYFDDIRLYRPREVAE
jgi:hypothetical protein